MNTLREVLDAAERAHVAVVHFNFSDLVTLKAVATSAHELRVPVMVGVSEGERAFLGVRQAAAAVRSFREELGLPIFLNADHTHSLKNAEDAAPAGFDEIIFDRSELPIEKNANETRRAVEAIKSINPSILMQQEKFDEAIPWLEKAKLAKRYEPRQFPFMNLGRIYLKQGRWWEALREFEDAVRAAPDDVEARKALHAGRARLN